MDTDTLPRTTITLTYEPGYNYPPRLVAAQNDYDPDSGDLFSRHAENLRDIQPHCAPFREFTIVVDLDAPVVEIENGTKLTFEFRRDDHVLVYATEKGENDPGVIPPSPDNGDRQKVTVWVDTAAITAGCGPIPVGSSHTG
jgi:hypothetical protein